MITAIARDTAAGAAVDMDSIIEEMMATCLGELRRLHRGQKEIQTTCVKLIGGLHEEVLRVVRELRALDKKCADVCVNWAHEARCRETRKSEKPPAIPRARHLASLEHSEDQSGTAPEFGKVESTLAHLTRSPVVVSIPRPVRFLLHFRLAGREAWTCGESSKRHMRTSCLG